MICLHLPSAGICSCSGSMGFGLLSALSAVSAHPGKDIHFYLHIIARMEEKVKPFWDFVSILSIYQDI